MSALVEENPTADTVLGGPENRSAVMNNLNSAVTALLQSNTDQLGHELKAANVIIEKAPVHDAQRITISKAFKTAVVQKAEWTAASAADRNNRENSRRNELQKEQAADGDRVLRGVVEALDKVGKQHWTPDKIVLNPKHFDLFRMLTGNVYSTNIRTLMDGHLTDNTTLFGVPLERGTKSAVLVNPEFQLLAVPGLGPDGTLGVVAQRIEVRQQIEIAINLGFCFKGHIITRRYRGDLVKDVAANEMAAIETLREMISETDYRRYIKYGFIMVTGKSGAIYQVFRNQSHTKVWENGKVVEEVCIRINREYKVPLTDSVIAFKTMIEADETEFKKLGNVYKHMDRAAA